MKTKKALETLRERLLEMASIIITEYWARATEQSKNQGEMMIRYGVRIRDERNTGRGVRILWGQIRWTLQNGSKRRPVFRDMTVPQNGNYTRNNFGGAKQWEVDLILGTEEKLVHVRRAMKLAGEMLMRLPALDKAVRDAEGNKSQEGLEEGT